MRTLATFLFVATAALLATSPCIAQDSDVYAEFMHKSGLWRQVADIEKGMELGLSAAEAKSGALDSRKREMLVRAFADVYSPDKLRAAIGARLATRLAVDDAKSALSWFDTPLGARIVKLEESGSEALTSSGLGSDAAMKAFAQLPDARRVLLERSIKAIDGSETAANIIMNQIIGMAAGAAALGGRAKDALAELNARAPLLRAQIKGAIEPSLVASSAVIYASLTDAEIGRYVEFLESETGKHTSAAVNAAMSGALNDAAIELGKRIGRDVEGDAARANET